MSKVEIYSEDLHFILSFDGYIPKKIIENLDKTKRNPTFQLIFDFMDFSDRKALFDLLNDYAFELEKYREYFRENNINNLKILYGDDYER